MTEEFSTSFGSASKLFARDIRQDIYNIYGLVRLADEIVDSYKGSDAAKLLADLEKDTYQTLETGYSINVIVHAFCQTARSHNIPKEIITPFFDSMRSDLSHQPLSQEEYERYIYGSAEVVGLMCLKVFCSGDNKQYASLEAGARALGSAFQKVNFLRDLHADYAEIRRYYFPVADFENFNDETRHYVIADIEADFVKSRDYIAQLPDSSKTAVKVAYLYYQALLEQLKHTSAKQIKQERIRVSDAKKSLLKLRALLRIV